MALMKMDYLSLLLLLSFLWICIHFLTKSLAARKYGRVPLPPGPKPFPIIGNIHQLGDNPPQDFANLSKTYGPIITVKLGSLTTIVISSAEVAKEIFQKHDQAVSGRLVPDSLRALDHHKVSMAWLPVAGPWRNLRKICAVHMFSKKQLDVTQSMRKKKLQELLDYLQEKCNSGSSIDIGQAVFTTVLNSISNTLFSIDLAHHHSHLSQSFKELACRVMEDIGNPNFADYFPILRFVDPQGSRKRMTGYFKKLFGIYDDIINERLQVRASSTKNKETNDVLDALLNLVEENNNSEYRLGDIKHLLLDLFFGGIDTTSSTVEWAMAELLRNPEILAKAKNELRGLLGKDGIENVEEFEISNFPYLQAIMNETLRLHPPGPLVAPHKTETEINMFGFRVPKNAQLFVNLWAMGRDPKVWPNSTKFMPERFLEREIDVKGRDFEFMPFGAGRRICPGLPLANRVIPLMLASLIYNFDWKLADGLKPEDVDMTEKFCFSLHKAKPLLVVPIQV